MKLLVRMIIFIAAALPQIVTASTTGAMATMYIIPEPSNHFLYTYQPITFFNTSSGTSAQTSLWDFGDGCRASIDPTDGTVCYVNGNTTCWNVGTNVTHTYSQPGVYHVILGAVTESCDYASSEYYISILFNTSLLVPLLSD